MNGGIEFTDRYLASGTPYPDPETICPGQCEGMGCVPVYMETSRASDGRAVLVTDREKDPELVRRWQAAEAADPSDDGWHFVICPVCEGTRLRPGVPIPDGWPPAVGSPEGMRPE